MWNSTLPGSVRVYAKFTGFRRAGLGYALSEPATSGPAVGGGGVGVSAAASDELRSGSPPSIGHATRAATPAGVGSEYANSPRRASAATRSSVPSPVRSTSRGEPIAPIPVASGHPGSVLPSDLRASTMPLALSATTSEPPRPSRSAAIGEAPERKRSLVPAFGHPGDG